MGMISVSLAVSYLEKPQHLDNLEWILVKGYLGGVATKQYGVIL